MSLARRTSYRPANAVVVSRASTSGDINGSSSTMAQPTKQPTPPPLRVRIRPHTPLPSRPILLACTAASTTVNELRVRCMKALRVASDVAKDARDLRLEIDGFAIVEDGRVSDLVRETDIIDLFYEPATRTVEYKTVRRRPEVAASAVTRHHVAPLPSSISSENEDERESEEDASANEVDNALPLPPPEPVSSSSSSSDDDDDDEEEEEDDDDDDEEGGEESSREESSSEDEESNVAAMPDNNFVVPGQGSSLTRRNNKARRQKERATLDGQRQKRLVRAIHRAEQRTRGETPEESNDDEEEEDEEEEEEEEEDDDDDDDDDGGEDEDDEDEDGEDDDDEDEEKVDDRLNRLSRMVRTGRREPRRQPPVERQETAQAMDVDEGDESEEDETEEDETEEDETEENEAEENESEEDGVEEQATEDAEQHQNYHQKRMRILPPSQRDSPVPNGVRLTRVDCDECATPWPAEEDEAEAEAEASDASYAKFRAQGRASLARMREAEEEREAYHALVAASEELHEAQIDAAQSATMGLPTAFGKPYGWDGTSILASQELMAQNARNIEAIENGTITPNMDYDDDRDRIGPWVARTSKLSTLMTLDDLRDYQPPEIVEDVPDVSNVVMTDGSARSSLEKLREMRLRALQSNGAPPVDIDAIRALALASKKRKSMTTGESGGE